MGLREGYILLIFMVIISKHVNANSLVVLDIKSVLLDQQVSNEIEHSEAITRSEPVPPQCQEHTSQIVDYLNKNETQIEIIGTLHQAFCNLYVWEHQCVLLVDIHAPLFFEGITTMLQGLSSEKVNCKEVKYINFQKQSDICTVCHHIVAEILNKLQDPDTKLAIIQKFLNACNEVHNFVQECKKLVFEYGPIILANAEKFLEKTDICTVLHLCKAGQTEKLVSSA